MNSRGLVYIGFAPGILRQFRLVQIRTFPSSMFPGCGSCFEALTGIGNPPHVKEKSCRAPSISIWMRAICSPFASLSYAGATTAAREPQDYQDRSVRSAKIRAGITLAACNHPPSRLIRHQPARHKMVRGIQHLSDP